ncbi:MAG: dihydrodipicolinate synthase family protein [Anaerolineae bacterium]
MKDKKLEGVFSPIPTPFTPEGELNEEALISNLEKWNAFPLGYIVLGSTGEFVHLCWEEKCRTLAAARRAIPQEKWFIAGAGCQSSIETLAMIEEAAGAGADAAMVINPSYYKGQMTDSVLADYYLYLAEKSPIPIIIYNLPQSTGIDLSARLVAELSSHPNIIGLKDSSGNLVKMGEMIRLVDPSFTVLAGSASFFFPALALGARGGVLALANIAPAQSVEIYRLFKEGEFEQGRALHLKMLPVNAAITTRWGIGGLKAAMDMLGFYGGPPRPPLPSLTDGQKEELRAVLREGGLL